MAYWRQKSLQKPITYITSKHHGRKHTYVTKLLYDAILARPCEAPNRLAHNHHNIIQAWDVRKMIVQQGIKAVRQFFFHKQPFSSTCSRNVSAKTDTMLKRMKLAATSSNCVYINTIIIQNQGPRRSPTRPISTRSAQRNVMSKWLYASLGTRCP